MNPAFFYSVLVTFTSSHDPPTKNDYQLSHSNEFHSEAIGQIQTILTLPVAEKTPNNLRSSLHWIAGDNLITIALLNFHFFNFLADSTQTL